MSQTTGSNPYDMSNIGSGNARLIALQKLTGGKKKGGSGTVVPQFHNGTPQMNQIFTKMTALGGQAAADRALDNRALDNLKKGGRRKSRKIRRKSRKRRKSHRRHKY